MLILALLACTGDLPVDTGDTGDPVVIPSVELDYGPGTHTATSASGMVAGTTGAAAVRAGLEILEEGGSAADAAVATAMAQIAWAMGSWVSYAGILVAVHYDAATGEVTALHAGYRAPLGETDPLSIPACGTPSGRTALVPGFMGGAEALHSRYGSLPWPRVVAPAIAVAEGGFELGLYHDYYVDYRSDVLTRLPETEAVFTSEDGDLVGQGDLFTQPALAATLREVATHGAATMYTGPWAERLVEAVAADGGALSAQDLAAWQPTWAEPAHLPRQGLDLYSLSSMDLGGISALEAMAIAERADLGASPPEASAQTLFWTTHILRVGPLLEYTGYWQPWMNDFVEDWYNREYDPVTRLTPGHADHVWSELSTGGWDEMLAALFLEPPPGGSHSDAVVAVDADGSWVALTHSINTSMWGTTGIFVDGVSIPDSACFQQDLLDTVGPGAHVPSPTNPTLVLRDGEPILAGSTIGMTHHAQVQHLVDVLDRGRSVTEAVEAPKLHGYAWAEHVGVGDFPREILDEVEELGLTLPTETYPDRAYWVGIQRTEAGLEAALTPELGPLDGHAAGY